jgi:hypothetical protein
MLVLLTLYQGLLQVQLFLLLHKWYGTVWIELEYKVHELVCVWLGHLRVDQVKSVEVLVEWQCTDCACH